MSDTEITAALQAALLKTFPLPEYATFFEVGDATGGGHSRWADAVSMACWPSRGLRIFGFELKASRSDWLREKKKPEKSVAIQRFCHHWVLVTAENVLQPGELPPTWGHLELAGGKLHWRTPTPALTPAALEPSFVAALLRRAHQCSAALIGQQVMAATENARKQAAENAEREIVRRCARNTEALQACERFQQETGVDLLCWTGRDAGKHFAAYRAALQASETAFNYGTSVKSLRAAADAIEAAEAALRADGLIREKATA
jgi:hypothetical protein